MADSSDIGHLMGHVKDAPYFEVPRFMAADGRIELPQPYLQDESIFPVIDHVEPFEFRFTKFMLLEAVVAVILALVFIVLANRMASGRAPRGRLWNFFEAMLVYIRDQVARPAIGGHDADRFMPFLWTMFFFVLGCNLAGMVPWAGSPTGSLSVTGALAAITFCTVVGSGMAKLGAVGFWRAQVPHMELPWVLALVLVPMMFVIEVMGLLIKHVILAVRLLANMFAGHLVLAVIIGFIAVTYTQTIWWGVMPASVLGGTALSLLELFVAFLQAYIFTFLSALFIGMAVHPH